MKDPAILVSPEEYLNSSYKPDMDYVDGVLVRRNVGTLRHGSLQAMLCVYFEQFRKSHRIKTFAENPLRWAHDRENPAALTVEPANAWRAQSARP